MERVDRGLTGFSGLSSRLDALSRTAASSDQDLWGRKTPPGGPTGLGGGLGAARRLRLDVRRRPAFAQYGLQKCHRQRLLGPPSKCPQQLRASSRIGAAASTVDGVTSMTELLTSGPAAYSTTPYRRSPARLAFIVGHRHDPPPAQQRGPHVWGGVGSFQASATVFGDEGRWSVTPVCVASAGTSCHLVVNFVPLRSGAASGTVTVSLPGGANRCRWTLSPAKVIGRPTHRVVCTHSRWRLPRLGVRYQTGKAGDRDGRHPRRRGYWEVAADGGVFSFGMPASMVRPPTCTWGNPSSHGGDA